ncbi:glutaredoxin family protein [Corynebacterium kutscheri]|uniref:glutaredoxin family protein n=1 Tax=Corynebacterium kutscheri TaxID=35755 RepID=UPI000F81AE58|nr:glutaredoxin family protein [Corynebacterium kutscheri]
MNVQHIVELMVRETCGSCKRIAEQIRPVIKQYNAIFIIRDVDLDPALRSEFGDRVPVIVVDGEEFACWEVDNNELAQALL